MNTYRPEIDGLRAISIIAVLLYHAEITLFGNQIFKGGFIGVDIFFVISGYLITSIILKELITTGTFSFKYFYERRIRRILPVLLVVILFSLPFAWMYLIPWNFKSFSYSVLYSLVFSSNFYFYDLGHVYGAIDGLLKPFLHTWSLSVEEQFYILFPLTFFFIFKFCKKYLIYFLIVGFLISLGLADWGSKNYPRFNFYVLPTRGWELLAGSILAYLEINLGNRSKNKFLKLVLPTIGLLLIGHSFFYYHDEMFHPSFYTISPIVGVCLIIWFSSKDELITKIISTKLFVGIGLISYSLYLWHYPIFSFAKMQFVTFSNFGKFGLLGVAFVLSIISYKLVERPIRDKKVKFSKVFKILFLMISIISIFNLSVIKYDGVKLDSRIHKFLWKYDNQMENFIKKYDYNNFNQRKNVFLVGNSYANDLLNFLNHNTELKEKYYFYTAVEDNFTDSMELDCFYLFLKENNKSCNFGYFSFLEKQYKESDYIIFHVKRNWFYFTSKFSEITEFLKNDKKKFIVLLDDISFADILDTYLMSHNKLPTNQELNELEISFTELSKAWDRENLIKAKGKLLENNIKFIGRSELYCNYIQKKCPLIAKDEKIYSDEGHLTIYGARHLSDKGQKLINILVN